MKTTCIVEFLREAGFFYLIWTVRHSIQSLTWTIPKLKQFFNFMYTTSDMNGHISSTTLFLNELATDEILNLTNHPTFAIVDDKQIWENPTCEGRLIYPEWCMLSVNKSNPIQFTGRFLAIPYGNDSCSLLLITWHFGNLIFLKFWHKYILQN